MRIGPGAIAIGLLLATSIGAQPDEGAFGRGTAGFWRSYDVRDGLAGDRVLCLFQDRTGYLWFGTESGVSRFDGQEFVNFTTTDGLVGNRVQGIVQDREGNIWFGTDRGASRFDGHSFRNFTAEDRYLGWNQQDRLAGDRIGFLREDSAGEIWFGTDRGISRYDGSEFTTLTAEYGLADDRVLAMLEDEKGHLWLGTAGGVSRYDGQLFTNYETGLGEGAVRVVAADRQGRLWFGGEGGVSRYDGESFTPYPLAEGVLAMLEDRRGVLWVGTDKGVIYRFDGAHWERFSGQEGGEEPVVTIFEDRSGDLWFGSQGSGVSRYDGEEWILFPTGWLSRPDGQILQDREGVLWFATSDGVYRYDGHEWQTFTIGDGLADDRVQTLFVRGSGELWAGTEEGVSRYDGTGWRTSADSLGEVRALVEDGEGGLWAGGNKGLFRHEGGNWEQIREGVQVLDGCRDGVGNLWFGTTGGALRYDGREWRGFTIGDGLADDRVNAVFGDGSGNIWLGTGRGLSRYDGREWQTFTTAEGLAHDEVLDGLVGPEGAIWVATAGGLSRYDGTAWTRWTTEEGLVHNRIESLYMDREGRLWCGTRRSGVCRFDGEVFQRLGVLDGLAGEGVRVVREDEEGSFWLGTDRGVSRYRPSGLRPPPIYLDGVIADRRYERVGRLALPSSLDVIAFEFHTISFKTRPEAMVYRFRLQGFDRGWRTTHARSVHYEDLPVGEYRFEVVAIDRDLGKSAEPATVDLEIHLPRERVNWSIALVVALGLALAQTIRLVRRERRLRGRREGQAQDVRQLQMGLMPEEGCLLPGFDIMGRCLPADPVSGNLFAFFRRGERLFLCLADVEGRDAEAAIALRVFHGVLTGRIDGGGRVEAICDDIERTLEEVADWRVRLLLGELDPESRRLRLVAAGGPAPLVWRAGGGKVERIDAVDEPLGSGGERQFAGTELALAPGDRVLFHSAGMVETCSAGGEAFGGERLAEAFAEGCRGGLSAEMMLRLVVGKLKGFSRRAVQQEDQSLLVVGVKGEEAQ